MPVSLWAPYILKLALHGNLLRTLDSSVYINNLFLGARGARTLQPAATPPSSSSFIKEMFTITSPVQNAPTHLNVHSCLDPSGPCSEWTWANKPVILGVGLDLSLPWYWPLAGPS